MECDLLERLQQEFGNLARPSTLFEVSDEYRQRFSAEFDHMEAMKWEEIHPSELSEIYEPNTYLSREAFLYLLPSVFRMCCKWPKKSAKLDLVSVFLNIPMMDPDFYEEHRERTVQELLVMDCIQYLSQVLDIDVGD